MNRKSPTTEPNRDLPLSKQTAEGVTGAILGGVVGGPLGAVAGAIAGTAIRQPCGPRQAAALIRFGSYCSRGRENGHEKPPSIEVYHEFTLAHDPNQIRETEA